MNVVGILLNIALSFTSIAERQQQDSCINWENSKSIKVYAWPKVSSLDELKKAIDTMHGHLLDIRSVSGILSTTHCEVQAMHFWHDYYLGYLTLSTGEKKILMISTQGDTVLDVEQNRFYVLPDDKRSDFRDLIKGSSK